MSDDGYGTVILKANKDDALLQSTSSLLPSQHMPSKWRTFLSFILDLRFEPMIAISMFAFMFRLMAYQQLVQDKICNQTFNKTLEYCTILPSLTNDPEKNAILTKTTSFMTTKELVVLGPNLVMGMFVGSWCDRYNKGRRIVMMASIIGAFIESVLLLFNGYFFQWPVWLLLLTGIPTSILGNGLIIVSVSYISTAVRAESRAFRFMLFEIFTYTSVSTGIFGAAMVMSSSHPFIASPFRTHNYTDVFLISAVSCIFLLFWAYYLVKLPPLQSQKPVIDMNANQISDEGSRSRNITTWKRLTAILSIDHVKDSWKTVLKKRPDNYHKILWWLLLYLNITMIPLLGAAHIYYPLTERLYNWNYLQFSRVSMIGTLLKPIGTIVALPVIFKLFKPENLQISMIGTMSGILGGLSMGSLVSPEGFYLGIFFSAFFNIGSVGVKAFMANFIPGDEISRIFSILLTIELIQPFVGTFVYSSIFKLTIDSYPSCAFHFTSFLLVLSLIIICCIDVSNATSVFKTTESLAAREAPSPSSSTSYPPSEPKTNI